MHTYESLLRDLLCKSLKNTEVEKYASMPEAQAKYDLNLTSQSEYEFVKDIALACRKGDIALENADANILANIIYFDVCDRQAQAIATELLLQDECSDEYYQAIFLSLGENFSATCSAIETSIDGSKDEASEMMLKAKDIIFAQRFEAFGRYDNSDILKSSDLDKWNPDMAMVALLNNDICLGAFWDDRVQLKNALVREHLQEKVNFILETVSSGKNVKESGFNDAQIVRLQNIVNGERIGVGQIDISVDQKTFDAIALSARKNLFKAPDKIREFVDKNKKPVAAESLKDLVSALEKMKGPKGGSPGRKTTL